MASYNQSEWHYGGKYPTGLPRKNASTHIGMFLAWAIHRGLESEQHKSRSAAALAKVRARSITGRDFFLGQCAEKFRRDDLNDEGNAFATGYYLTQQYHRDYQRMFPSGYRTEDTWENFDRIFPIIEQKFEAWKLKR